MSQEQAILYALTETELHHLLIRVLTQTLSFPIRLPDALQDEALRLLDASRVAINEIITQWWKSLDLFAGDRTGPAWKQVFQAILPLLSEELI